MPPQPLFTVLCVAWAASEIWIGWRLRSDDPARTRDSGTLRLLLLTIYACLALAVWLSYAGLARFGAPWREGLSWSGLVLMTGGLALRWWSIRVLDRFFTVDVAIHAGHKLIRHGPYRLLRHPSYTGALMTFYGFGLALGNIWSLLVVTVPVTLAFLWRIRIEERVLSAAFPGEYADYARATKRLVPYLW
jgi:protein-S-isoprenylcysteine O-methyltransferase